MGQALLFSFFLSFDLNFFSVNLTNDGVEVYWEIGSQVLANDTHHHISRDLSILCSCTLDVLCSTA